MKYSLQYLQTKIFSRDTNILPQAHWISNIFGHSSGTTTGRFWVSLNCPILNFKKTVCQKNIWMQHWVYRSIQFCIKKEKNKQTKYHTADQVVDMQAINFMLMKNNKMFLFWITIKKLKKNFMAPFYGWGSTASRLEPLRGGSLLFTTKKENKFFFIQ